mmetsp:Transcript_9162/g.33833  ORF Transcript_9162/g.33833 Transcript_9162/m.33833 type:complete len:128 (-) Transcript_9162:4142-4525(-)
MPDEPISPNSQQWVGDTSFLNVETQNAKPSIPRKAYRGFVNVFDSYGESLVNSPTLRQKSLAGACLSITFKVIFVILLTVAIIKLATDKDVISGGKTVVYNIKESGSGKQLDFPAMQLELESSLLFF